MTIVDFYKRLSRILEDCRERFKDKAESKELLEKLLEEAKESKLSVNIDPKILDDDTLMKLDDERSFTEPEPELDSSYEEDEDNSYEEDEDSSYSY
jgi:hypothetical protein